MTNSKNIKAFTLIEVILYLGLFAIIFFVIIQFFIQIEDSNARTEVENEIEKTILFVNTHLIDTIEKSNSVDTNSSVFDISDGVLVLNDGTTYRYDIYNSRLRFNNGSQSTMISSPKLTVNQFLVEEIINDETQTVGVRITLQLTSNKKPITRTITTAFLL